MKRNWFIAACLSAGLFLPACAPEKSGTDIPFREPAAWQEVLREKLPLLGHRNWIVVTDMAYPLQSRPGITTLYAAAPYPEVLKVVKKRLEKAPHVSAVVYQDRELSFLQEEDCPGITRLKEEMRAILPPGGIERVAHDRLIARLDSVSNRFEVVIIKTNLAMPYTSTFFELDCRYWNGGKQAALDARIRKAVPE
ncbi:MAG: hypothetical protein LIP00_02655 [Parabacteroides sp.]|nr:hypothetical protein [Parabacteroides sp.]